MRTTTWNALLLQTQSQFCQHDQLKRTVCAFEFVTSVLRPSIMTAGSHTLFKGRRHKRHHSKSPQINGLFYTEKGYYTAITQTVHLTYNKCCCSSVRTHRAAEGTERRERAPKHDLGLSVSRWAIVKWPWICCRLRVIHSYTIVITKM